MVRAFEGELPALGDGVWIADSAEVIGRVTLGANASVWYGCVLRGDVMPIRIGEGTNIQDLTVIHVTTGKFAATIGARVTVGHRAVLHGCTVGDGALIGIGSVVLDGAEIGEEALVGAGALVTPGTKIPARMLALGSPCKPVRALKPDELEQIAGNQRHYVELARKHRASGSPR